MRTLGVDPGSVRTGLAVADDDVPVAIPLVTLRHKSVADAIEQLVRVVREQEVREIVIGLPLALDGRDGDAARRSRKLGGELSVRTKVPVVMWDERLSSASAERALRAQGMKGPARRNVVDQAAATLLLQSYLDAQRDRTWNEDSAEPSQSDPHVMVPPRRERAVVPPRRERAVRAARRR